MSPTEPPETRRLFFAIWPDEALREEIRHLARERLRTGGRPVAPENLHITLFFLGPVAGELFPCIAAAAAGVQGKPFTLRLDQLGHWPRPRVVWLGATQLPPPLARLVGDLSLRLRPCGFEPERRPFQAHMTLLRKVARAGPFDPIAALDWKVDEFVLVASQTLSEGVRYQVLRRWPLVTAENPPQG